MLTRTEIIISLISNMFSDWNQVKKLRAMFFYYKKCPVDEFIFWTRLPIKEITKHKFYIS